MAMAMETDQKAEWLLRRKQTKNNKSPLYMGRLNNFNNKQDPRRFKHFTLCINPFMKPKFYELEANKQ